MGKLIPSILLVAFGLLVSFMGRAAVNTTTQSVYFQTNSYVLSDETKQQLNLLVKQLPTTGEIEIAVAGHTDAEGTGDYNKQLSKQRAGAVANELAELGVPLQQISTTYFGELKPVANNTTDDGKGKNRRVEITIKHTVINSLTDIVNTDALLGPQHFDINTTQAQEIKGKNGIEISIPADAFTDANGHEVKAGTATLALTEFMHNADAFFNGVTTISDKGVLESGGMFNLTATANGQPLQLKPGKQLQVNIPAEKTVDGMKVYTSKTDSTGQLVWVETPAAFSARAKPVDTRTIQLAKDKYKDFLAARIDMPTAESVNAVYPFLAKEPQPPIQPHLTLRTVRDLRTSGVRAITHNKAKQQVYLDRINQKIQADNDKKKAKYEKQRAQYIVDSATFPTRHAAYMKEKMQYNGYVAEQLMQIDSLDRAYRDAIVKKCLRSYLSKSIALSDNNTLYNADLVARARAYCMNEYYFFSDHAFERKMATVDEILRRNPSKQCNYIFAGNEAQQAFKRMLLQPDVQQVLTALIDDNPYLTEADKKIQKAALTKSNMDYFADNAQQTTYYTATIGQMGFVNCDRLHQNDDVVAMKIDSAGLNTTAESMAFIKGLNASQHIGTGVNRFLRNDDLKLLSVYFKEGRPQVAFREVKMNSPQTISLQYKEMKVEEFKMLVLSFI